MVLKKKYSLCAHSGSLLLCFQGDGTLRAPPNGKTGINPETDELLPYVPDPQVSGNPYHSEHVSRGKGTETVNRKD